MKSTLLTAAIVCAVLFIIASVIAGGPFSGRRSSSGFWMAVQNLSAVLGILAFVIQMIQWGRGPRA